MISKTFQRATNRPPRRMRAPRAEERAGTSRGARPQIRGAERPCRRSRRGATASCWKYAAIGTRPRGACRGAAAGRGTTRSRSSAARGPSPGSSARDAARAIARASVLRLGEEEADRVEEPVPEVVGDDRQLRLVEEEVPERPRSQHRAARGSAPAGRRSEEPRVVRVDRVAGSRGASSRASRRGRSPATWSLRALRAIPATIGSASRRPTSGRRAAAAARAGAGASPAQPRPRPGRLDEREGAERHRVVDVEPLGEREEERDDAPDGERHVDARPAAPRARATIQTSTATGARKKRERELPHGQPEAVGEERPRLEDALEPVARVRDVAAARPRLAASVPATYPMPFASPRNERPRAKGSEPPAPKRAARPAPEKIGPPGSAPQTPSVEEQP